MRDIFTTNERLPKQPKPLMELHELGESFVNFAVQLWVNTDDHRDITRAVTVRVDTQGVSIPFPPRDVHLFTATSVEEQRQT